MLDFTTEYWTYKLSPDLPPEPAEDYDILDADGDLIAIVIGCEDKTKTETLARLIAAVPEMYSLLETLADYKSYMDDEDEIFALGSSAQTILNRINNSENKS